MAYTRRFSKQCCYWHLRQILWFSLTNCVSKTIPFILGPTFFHPLKNAVKMNECWSNVVTVFRSCKFNDPSYLVDDTRYRTDHLIQSSDIIECEVFKCWKTRVSWSHKLTSAFLLVLLDNVNWYKVSFGNDIDFSTLVINVIKWVQAHYKLRIRCPLYYRVQWYQ